MKNYNIAIVSYNRQKYSETFIHSHLKYLSDNVLFMFDGYLPGSYSCDKLQTENKINTKSTFWKKKGSLSDSILKLLVTKKVSVVLAEYGPSGVEMADICNNAGIPLIVHFHGYDAYRNDVLSTYGRSYADMFKKATAVVAVSNDMNDQLLKLGCPPQKIYLVPYGIELKWFYRPKQIVSTPQFVSCGRFVAKKGPGYTIEAFAKVCSKYNKASLVMIGDGELLEECKMQVKNLGLQQKVIFKGVISPTEIAEIFSCSSIFLQHSIITESSDSEGTPLSIMEAGASGLPVVSTFHGGIPDVVKDGQHGFLVKEKDVDSMADRMLYLIQNAEIAFEMGQTLQKKIVEQYSMERYIADLKKIISSTQS